MSGFENALLFAENADFSGAAAPALGNGLQTDNQIWVGSTTPNSGGTHVDVLTLTAGDNVSLVRSPGLLTINSSNLINRGKILDYNNDFLDSHNYLSTAGTGGSSNIGYGTSAANPGQVLLQTSGAFASASLQTQNFFIPGSDSVVYDNVFQIATLSSAANRISVQAGLVDQFGGLQNGNPTNGIYFQYEDDINSGKWQCITKSAGVATTTNTTITADTNFHHYSIQINAAGTSVAFYIDNVLVATNTTNIPSVATAIAICLGAGASTGTTMQVAWDLYNFVETLTANRF